MTSQIFLVKISKTKLNSNKDKYTILNTILYENSITVLFGDDNDYFSKLDSWISNF
jgi:hypothetical protein